MVSPYFFNTCWMLSCLREARLFNRASRQVCHAQSQLLRSIVAQNKDTWFGKSHNFSSIWDVGDFQKAVPLTTYEDYVEPIQRIAQGDASVLTFEPIELLEPTSGTTSGEKLIPYTATLRNSFQRAIKTWIWDLFSKRPFARRGFAYWSVSPLAGTRRTTESGIPIGFDDDASYLGTYERWFLSRSLAVPPEVALSKSVRTAQYSTLFFLLRCPQLSLISVWSPTFLQELIDYLRSNWPQITQDVRQGAISSEQAEQLPDSLAGPFEPQPKRAEQIEAIMNCSDPDSDWVRRIWPELAMVSCWTDGPSSSYAVKLQQSLPGIEIQPKGLLATEAFVSIPLVGYPGSRLAIRSHFFEFQHVDASGAIASNNTLLAHQLQEGEQYRVAVTTSGGLYRYQLMDQVEVVGFYKQVPLLRFLGKCNATTDLVGEKLSAAHVQAVLSSAFQEYLVSPTYCQLVAQKEDRPYYLLRIVAPSIVEDTQTQQALCRFIDAKLSSNPGYRYARDLNQLSLLQIDVLDQAEANILHQEQTLELVQSGTRLGDIKPTILYSSAGSP